MQSLRCISGIQKNSIKKDSKKIHKYFDELYTFDRIDSISMDKYKFLPLFYNHIYETIGKMKKNTDINKDCMYVGNGTSSKVL